MFLNVGNTMHNVGITQAVGRIMGTARPEMNRVLYAKESIVSEFKKFNHNQKTWINKVAASTEDISVKTIIDTTDFCKFKRNIDRPALKLHMKQAYEYVESEEEDDSESDGEWDEEDEECEDIKKIVDRWWQKDNISGKVLTYIYDNSEVECNNIIEFLKCIGSNDPKGFTRDLVRGKYGMIYKKTENMFVLRAKAHAYIETL
jgi:hypothetical protein